VGSDYSLEAIAKVIAYGVPALLILLGFFGYIGGYTIAMLTGDVGIMNFGAALIAIGLVIYIVELALKVYSWFIE